MSPEIYQYIAAQSTYMQNAVPTLYHHFGKAEHILFVYASFQNFYS